MTHDTTAYAIMHLTGEQARSALMLLASEREEDIRAAVDRVLRNERALADARHDEPALT